MGRNSRVVLRRLIEWRSLRQMGGFLLLVVLIFRCIKSGLRLRLLPESTHFFLFSGISSNTIVNKIHTIPALPSFVMLLINMSNNGVLIFEAYLKFLFPYVTFFLFLNILKILSMDVLITKIFFNTLYLSTYKITNIAHRLYWLHL